jgi:hypothetical protein
MLVNTSVAIGLDGKVDIQVRVGWVVLGVMEEWYSNMGEGDGYLVNKVAVLEWVLADV